MTHSLENNYGGSEHDSEVGNSPRLRRGASSPGSGRRRNAAELAEAVPVLRVLATKDMQRPSPAQWSAFTRKLHEGVEAEARKKGLVLRVKSVRDRVRATDSRVVRGGVKAFVAAAVAAVLGAVAWLIAQVAPVPAFAYVEPATDIEFVFFNRQEARSAEFRLES